MVAGMLMPLDRLRAIYEILFRDGVMVAKNDERPQSRHAEVPGVTNLQVTRALGSLKSRGFVRETFVWKHCYWYLTNEGIDYLRQYLHLPPEIVPASLQRVRRPVPTPGMPRRTPAANVQTVRGPTSYAPKPQADAERQEYRRREETVPPRGQNAVNGSIGSHVLENSWQEGGWQRWAERDSQGSVRRGTSHAGQGLHVSNAEEKWGIKESQGREDIRKTFGGETERAWPEKRVNLGTTSAESWTVEKKLGDKKPRAREEDSKGQTGSGIAELVTALSPVISTSERREEKTTVSAVTSTSQTQFTEKLSGAKLGQQREEARKVVSEKSVEVHVVSSVTEAVVTSHRSLEITDHQQGVREKAIVQGQLLLGQELKQEKDKGQLKQQKAKEKQTSLEADEIVKVSSLVTSAPELAKVESKKEVKQQKKGKNVAEKEEVQVSNTHKVSTSQSMVAQGPENDQGKIRNQKPEKEEVCVALTPAATKPEPPKTESKTESGSEGKKGQKKKELAQEKTSEDGAVEKPTKMQTKGVSKREAKNEPKQEQAAEATQAVAQVTPNSASSKVKKGNLQEEKMLKTKSEESGAQVATEAEKVSPASTQASHHASIKADTQLEVSQGKNKKGSKSKGEKAKREVVEPAEISATHIPKKEMELESILVKEQTKTKQESVNNHTNIIVKTEEVSGDLNLSHSVSVSSTYSQNNEQDAHHSELEGIRQDLLAVPDAGISVPKPEQMQGTNKQKSKLDLVNHKDLHTVNIQKDLAVPELVTITQNPPVSKEEELQAVPELVNLTQNPPVSKEEKLQPVSNTVDLTQNPTVSKEKELKTVSDHVVLTKKPPASKKEKLQLVSDTVVLTQKPSESKKEEKLQPVSDTVILTQNLPVSKEEELQPVSDPVVLTQNPPVSKEEKLQPVSDTVVRTQNPPVSKEEERQPVSDTVVLSKNPSVSKKEELQPVSDPVVLTQNPPVSKEEELQTVSDSVVLTLKPPGSKKEEELQPVSKTGVLTQNPPVSKKKELQPVSDPVVLTQNPPVSKEEELQTVSDSVVLTQKPPGSKKEEERQPVSKTVALTQNLLVSKKEELQPVSDPVVLTQNPPVSKKEDLQLVSDPVVLTQNPPGSKKSQLQAVSETVILTQTKLESTNHVVTPEEECDPGSTADEDERDRVQKKTFTKWVNKHLIKAHRHVNDLYEDLRDGHNLISLLEVLSGETLPREKGRMRFHKLQNVQIALDFLKLRQVKLVNIRNDDIADGNPKLTLGLIWTIILHFQISDIQVSGQSEDMTAKEKLLLWSQRMTEGYQGLRCDNFTSNWRDGRLFNAIIHRHKPMLIDMTRVYRQSNLENLDQAFGVAEKDLGVTRLLDPEDVDVPQPDEKSIITYVSSLYDAMPRVPDVQDGVRANELELRWHEYYERVTMLLQWIRHYTIIFEEKRFPASYEEIEILWRQFLKFKETELPSKEADKNQSKLQYQSLEGAVKSGQLKVPAGYHPLDVEKEWGKLHVSILEREKLLRIELERLERLQRIVSKLQMESGLCEEQLNQADALLQTNIRLLNAGKQPQRAADIERDLDKADSMIRILFNDVQALKDGRHPQGEQMYRRVYRLHERLVAIRTEYNLRIKSGATQVVTQVTHITQQSIRPDADDITLRYLQDLLSWVEENQKRINSAEWGSDLSSVESQLGSHRGLHQSINEFRAKIERARADEAQISGARGSYQEYLGKLDLQYAKLLNSSKARLRHLESLHAFVAAATKELMWLNDKEEEEVNFDWSERNTNMTSKKDNYSGFMRELELKEKKIKEIQNSGDRLLRDDHPSKSTVEAFQAALQTQWSWMLQLCCCIEAHLKENTAYFQFFSDVKEAAEHLKKIQDTMRRKYTCDRSITVTRLEDLVQDSMDEKEQLTEYKGQVASLAKRAKTIIQLKPRSPTNPPKGQQPIQAVCDYRQLEITVHKGDDCLLVNNSQPNKWKVLNASGSDALVPSVCFIVPPPNKEAVDAVNRLESSHQSLLTSWHTMHIDLKSLLSYQYLLRDIQLIQSWSLITFRTMTLEEQKLALRNLEIHYQDFMRDSQDSQNFHPDDRMNIEREYSSCTQKYDMLLRSLERGEQDESTCKNYISQLKNIQLQLEGCESRTVTKIRSPLDKDPIKECSQRIGDQQQIHFELETIQKNLDKVSEKTRKLLSQPDLGESGPVLRSEHDVTQQKMDQVYSLSTIYLEKLKTINLVIRNTHGAEEIVKTYEDQLKDVQTVPSDLKELENSKSDLKRMRGQVEGHQPLFSGLENDLSKAREVSEKMMRAHSERDADLDRYREKVQQLLERWQAIILQIDVRQRELEQLGKQLRYYRESYEWLIRWILDAKQRQEKIQSVPITDSRTVRTQLLEEKKLLEESEKNREKVDECQKYAKQYIDAIKDFELQLVTYKAHVEPAASPLKKPKVQSASDNIIQEYVELRTKYSELTTLTSQYIKFITETLRRLEEEERATKKLKEEERKKLAEVEAQLEKQRQLAEAHAQAKALAEKEALELRRNMHEEVTRREVVAVDAEQQKKTIQQELQQMKHNSEAEINAKAKLIEEAEYNRKKVEEEIRIIRLQLETSQKQKSGAEDELKALRARAEEAERQKRLAQEEADRLRKQVKDEAQKKREAEEELQRKIQAEKEAAKEKQKALEDLEKSRLQAEEAERRMKQAELEKERQIKQAHNMAQQSAEAELQSKRMSFLEKTTQLEISLKQEHITVTHLQEEAERLKKQQLDAENAREEAEKELEKWRQKANEALRLRLQAEEIAHKKALAQEEAEKQKEDAEREARKRAKAEESALRQKELAEEELEKQRKLADDTAVHKLSAEQELIRLKAEVESGEQQRFVLEEDLYRLKNEVNEAIQRRKGLEEELTKVRAEMEILLQAKSKAEEESRSTSEKSKQMLEAEAGKLRELAEEAARLRALSEEAKRQRQLAEEEVTRQRAEAERILKEKLAAINEATRLKTEAEIALKEKEAENERLRRLAEDEAYQRKLLEDQATQHKQDIEEKILLLKQSSENELERQKHIVDETVKHRRIIEEEIRILKINFEKASSGKSDLELELQKLKNIAEETQESKLKAEQEAEKQRQLALEEEAKRKEAEEKVKKIIAAEQEAARQRKLALEEVERLKAKAEEAKKQKELAEKEAEKQIQLAQEASRNKIQAEEKAYFAAVQQKEQELMQTRMQEQSIFDKLKEEAEKAKRAAEEAERARAKAEHEAVLSRQQAEEAERLKLKAEEEAQAKAQAQEDAEHLRKEAELEAAKRAQAEQAALKQKHLADAEMEKHKKFAEKTLRQKDQVEGELTKVKLQLEETDHQKTILDEELGRLKEEVTESLRQKKLVEDELFKVKIQMEELIKLKIRIEEENKILILKDKDSTQKFLVEEAEKMKQVAEEAARLSIEAQEAARLRKIAEDDLNEQRALAEKILKEKMQAVQEATRLKAEAELLQKQKQLAMEQAKKLQEDKEQMQQQLAEETEGFQKILETERRRQLDISSEAERLKLQVVEMSKAQAKAEEDAKKFKKRAEEISEKLHQTELSTKEKMTVVHTLEIQRQQSDKEAEDLKKAIADLEKEKEKLKKEAELLQKKSEEMEMAQQEQLRQETQTLQSSFLSEKQILIHKEKYIEEEKAKLEKLFETEVDKAKKLKSEKERQLGQLEEEKKLLQMSMDDAVRKQLDAEDKVRQKQEELQQLDKRRREQENLLEEENRKLRERLEQLEQEHRIALEKTREIVIHKETIITQTRAMPNGSDSVDASAQNGDQENAFDGLRQKVSPTKLYEAGILTKEMLDKLSNGQVSVGDLSQREEVRKYLQGKSSIAGLLLKPSNEKMSIYDAMKKKLITPGTALILLEAQAASGFIIDPVRNKKLSVSEAVKENVIGPEVHNKMLSAERAITGYKDPYTGEKISLFQAMNKDLIVKDHGIRLLEAQIATGGIVDPVNSHRLPLDVAYQRGYFDEEMSKILSDPTDDTKGFFDPNTQENLTYLQLMERCVVDPETKLCLLPLTSKAGKGDVVYTDSEAKDIFKKATVSVPFGRFQGKTVTIWEIINSEYFTEEQRRDLLRQYKTGKITVEKIIKIIITVVEENEKKKQMCFDGLRNPVPAAELVESKIIDNDLFNQLHQGKKSVKDLSEVESIKKYLTGSTAIAGVQVEKTGEKQTLFDAIRKNLLKPATALSLLEAQAGTGFIIDPVNNELLPVDDAVKAGTVGPEYHEKLLSAEKAVTGYKDPYTGQTLSLFQALKKGLIPKDSGIRLLDAQLATGGIIDPVNSHRLPLEIAYKRGHLDEETAKLLSEPVDENTGFYDPNSQENLSYAQLQKKCKVDKKTGHLLLPLSDQAIQAQLEELYSDSQAKEAFDKTTIEVPVGSFKGRTITIWELIHSEYFTEEQRRELIRQYKTGKVTIEKIIKIMITIVEETESKKQQRLTFTGLRAPVPANELLEANIINQVQFEQLKDGKKSVKEISETESVKRYLQGSDCIAGVFVEENNLKMNIYQAMKRNMLMPGTALVLLEAQAATGFIIDPVKNQKFYVNEAVKAGVVGPELHEKLLSAEKAVTGYKDPYSGNTISVFEAMQKGLLLKDHGIRLLEAQIATGGIIDPVHSHRVPVEVAYKRGYFDETMNKILADPSDDTKGFFDPNTHENLTYLELKERCIKDPETGLTLLPLKKIEKPAAAESSKVYTETETKKVFEETSVDIPAGTMAGSTMTIWELMHSDLLPKEERERLMMEFQAGKLSKERMIIIIIEIIEKTEIIREQEQHSYDFVRRRITAEELYESKIISIEIYNMLKQGTKTIQEIIQIESVWRYLYGTGCVAGLQMPGSKVTLSIYQAMKKGFISTDVAYILLDAQAATGFIIDPVKNELLTVDEAVRKGIVGPEIHDRLLSAERAVTGYRDPYTEQMISIFQAMKKDLIPSDQALRLLDAQLSTGGIIDPRFGFHIPHETAFVRGYLNKDTFDMLSEPSEVRSYVDPSTDEKLSYSQLLKRCHRDEKSNLFLLPLADKRKLTFKGLRKEISMEELIRSNVMDTVTAQRLQDGLTSIEEVSRNLQKFLEGTSCIAGVYVEATKERYSIYQAMKKGMIRPGTAFELLEAQAATGYVIDPIKCLKLAVEDSVRMGIVGPEFKDKLLSAERAVTGYKDPYSGKLISLFQAMKKGLILKDHGIRLLEAQIATGGIIDPEESHRLPVEMAYKRGLFDEEMNEILTDPSDDTKGFFDPNTEENLTYLQLMERCMTDPDTGLCLLPLKEKKRERKTSSKSSVRKRRVVIVDPETGKEMSVYEAYRKGLIDHQTYIELSEQECEWEEVTISSSDGVVKSMITDRRSGRQYDIDDAIFKGLIDQTSLDQYRSGSLSITEFADMLSGNAGGFRSRSSSVGSSSSIPASPAGRAQLTSWNDPTEETGPIAGIVDTDTLEKVSITEAMHRNLVDNITGQRLLEAQACTGGIIDSITGEKFSVADAVNKGLVDKIMVDRINLAQKAFNGFEDPRTKTKMSAAQALKKGWLYYEAGQRFLEVQYLTGGLIEPEVAGRVNLDDALHKGTIDSRTAQKLRDVNTYSKYLTCPKTKLKISYKEAMEKSMVEDGTGLRLLEASSQSSKGYYSPYNVSGSGSASGSRSGSRTGSRSGSRRGSVDGTGNSNFSMSFSSASYSSTSYGRRYTNRPQDRPIDPAELANALLNGSQNCSLEFSRGFKTLPTLLPSLVSLPPNLSPARSSTEVFPADQQRTSSRELWRVWRTEVQDQVRSLWLCLQMMETSLPDLNDGFLQAQVPQTMGNSVSRPSCLGDKSRKSEQFLKECCLKKESLTDIPSVRNNAEPSTTVEKKQNELVFEKELNVAPSSSKTQGTDPLPKQNNADANVQNAAVKRGTPRSTPDHMGNVWTPQRGTLDRASGSSWSWKPLASREVTEVTEVTETVVTEIVEVTQYPTGDRSGEPVVTRTVKVLTECAGELAEVQTSREAQTETQYRMGQWDSFSKTVSQHALALPEPPDNLDTVRSWVSEMEELTEAQKPPSSEAKVVKAQLQEQKLLQRLLQERRPRIERVFQGKSSACQPLPIEGAGQKEQRSPLSELQDRWDSLLHRAEERHRHLERITPAAQNFQELLDAFHDWMSATERQLAELWRTNRSMYQMGDTQKEAQELNKDVQSKPGDLERVLEKGEVMLELVSGEEAQLCQEKMDALRVRYIIIAQSAGDILKRLDQAVEISAHLDPSQEDVSLWLGRMEKVASSVSSGGEGERSTLSASDTEKLEQIVLSELAHLSGTERRLEELGRVTLNVETIQAQIREHKLLAVDVLQHRGITDRLFCISDILLSLCPQPIQEQLQPSLSSSKEMSPRISSLVASSPCGLEHALSLLGQFSEAEEELLPWMQETEAELPQLSPNCAGSCINFRAQQQQLQALREVVAEHKPLVTKLHRVSCKLSELCPEGGSIFQQRFEAAEKRYCSIREAVRQAASVLEDTVPRYNQINERIDMMCESLDRLRSRMQNPLSVRGEPSRILEQLRENSQVQAELEKLGVGLENISRQGIELVSSLPSEAAQPQGIQQRTAQVLADWQQLCERAEERDAWLSGLLLLAERFWHGLSDLALTLADTQQMVLDTEEPDTDPDCIRTRLDAMQALREDIDNLQNDLDTLGSVGVELMSLCGDMDKPDVTKSLDELYATWNSLSKHWGERYTRLEEHLKAKLACQETIQRLQDWLLLAELRLAEEFLVSGDLDMAKRQLSDLKEFKKDLYQHRVALESIGCQILDKSDGSQLSDFRQRWDRLEEEAVNRQHQLEGALLGLGQFQNQLEELVNWLSHTTEQLQGPRLVGIDLQSCEIELAKHKVLRNDVLSHSRTVQSVDEAGRGILLTSLSDGTDTLQYRLREMNQLWEFVQSETERRQLELENDLSRVQDVTLEITDLLQWLEQVEARLSLSKPAWGHPESTRDALTKHLDLCKEMESKQHTYNSVNDRLQRLLATSPHPRGSSVEHQIRILDQKWESASSKVQDRKGCLSDGLAMITEFHSTMQEVSQWIGQAEGRLNMAGSPSVVLETVTNQIQEHKGLVQEIHLHAEKLSTLESVCSRLKDVSRKQEGDMTQTLVQSGRERLGKVQERAAERGRSLEESRRQAKQYSESRRMLLEWLQEVDQSVDSQQMDTSVSQEHIKQQLGQHKEFQKILRSKRPVYEATLRSGRALREKVRLPEDGQKMDESLGQLRERWEHVCNRSTERQQKLEECLLFSGKFTDALQALMDWLYRAEPQLSEEIPLGGDRDLVTDLLDKHKAFQKELGKRASSMKTLKHSVRNLSRGGGGTDSHWLQRQMEELGHRWEVVCQLSVSKRARLEASLQQAEEFNSLVNSFLEGLCESERTLKYGVIPEEEQALQECQIQQQELTSTLQCQQLALECIVSLGQEILSACHPDSVITIKSWLTISKTRYQEVVSWARQQGERIQAQIQALATEREEVARLMDWITSAEEALMLRDQDPLPEVMEALEEMISQHSVFMEELSRKEPEVEKVTKNCKRKVTEMRATNPRKAKRQNSGKSPQIGPSVPLLDLVPQTPHMTQLLNRWQQLWFLSLDRQCRLQNAQQRLQELQEFAHFDFAVWRKRYMQWIGQMKSRILDIFRGIDRDQDGRISQREFMDSVLSSRFPTNSLEMTAVANIFDINGDGFIDYYEFVSALHPTRDPLRRCADADQIQDEVNRQVAQCNCAKRFQVQQISANRYRFGESQLLRMVRILRSTLMVRVGGGWIALDEFLVKNDPCRVKGRTNLKINEKYFSPDSFSSSAPKCAGNQNTAKGSNSSLSLYTSASAPSSPQNRKQTVLRRTRSGDRCHRSRSSLITDSMELKFSAAEDSTNSTATDKTDTTPT
ncbi:plectin [Pseudophryne corroboree]|uniref:plectin n=1 Tax=Pseudophryne corroboree TaxID=495146 RepID=UPI003081BB69